LNTYRNRIFDGNRIISPIFVIVLVFGITLSAVVPPVGVALIIWAALIQRRFRRGHRQHRSSIRAALVEREERERIRIYRSFNA